MAVNDYLDTEAQRTKEAREKAARKQQQRREAVQGFITRSFNRLADTEKTDKHIARAVARNTTFDTFMTACLPVRSPLDLARNFLLSANLPQPGEVVAEDIRGNEGYKKFEAKLAGQGYRIAELTVGKEYVYRTGTFPVARMKIEPLAASPTIGLCAG